jgi:threonine/homoserine/homoserine lactone efflux protein
MPGVFQSYDLLFELVKCKGGAFLLFIGASEATICTVIDA